ncbi:putative Cytochrome P450 [Seiridium unicorne]|uniref:Cytochrome P450 n=1 Tax=Seiridium unicorne TaxID=138068 RepID=A0ABR2VJM2_9PEZI
MSFVNINNTLSEASHMPLGLDLSMWFTPKYAISFIVLVVSLAGAAWKLTGKPTQRLVPGVYIVGGDSKNEIKKTREQFRYGSKDLIFQGYEKTGGTEPYYVPSELGIRMVIPTRFMEELKSAPMDKVDFVGIVQEMFEGKHTGVGTRSRMVPGTLNSHLTPNLGSIMPELQDEVRVAINDEFPACEDWTQLDIMHIMTQIVTRASSRMIGGTAFSRDKDWLKAAIGFAHWSFDGAKKIKAWPELLRPVAAPWISEVRKEIPWSFHTSEKLAVPILEQRARDGEQPTDFMQFLKDVGKGPEKEDKFISKLLVLTAFASVHTSVSTIVDLIYDLCEHPEYCDILREEYQGIADAKGTIPKTGFSKMVKMDSIMKESQRLRPVTLLTFERMVTEDKKLSNGLTIPAGTQIGVPNYCVAMDARIFPEPEKFDGLRFEKMRQADPSMENKMQFISCNAQSMAFGYGRHACPGRAFMDQEYKAIMVKILLNFDFKFPDGVKRPPHMSLDSQYVLSPIPVMFRRRKL